MMTVLSLALASPVFANSGGKKGGHGGGGNKPRNHREANWTIEDPSKAEVIVDEKKAGKGVELPMIILPVSNHGRLENYLFLSVRINLQKDLDPWVFREKSHFISDAIIRNSHDLEENLVKEDHTVDQEMVKALVAKSILPWIAQDQMESIDLTKMDLSR
jgi:hypothetical protein